LCYSDFRNQYINNKSKSENDKIKKIIIRIDEENEPSVCIIGDIGGAIGEGGSSEGKGLECSHGWTERRRRSEWGE